MGEKKVIRSKYIVTPEAVIDGYILVEPPLIKEIRTGLPPDTLDNIFDYKDSYILPGFIDMHIHGIAGFDVHGGSISIREMTYKLAQNGVTAFSPTTAAFPIEALKNVLQSIYSVSMEQKKHSRSKEKKGANIIGVHLEGPFLNVKEKGAMVSDFLMDPDLAAMKELEEVAQGLIRRVTLAPELPGGLDLIKYLKKRGYIVAGGHTNATYDQMIEAVNSGVEVANHMFNAMTGLHHREPGCVGAFLGDPRVKCELIVDNFHVHPAVMELALKCKGVYGICLISDAVLAAGLSPGEYEFAGQKITVDEEGWSRLQNGTIAGSTVLMPAGVKNLVETLGLSLVEAARLASTNPAEVLGINNEKGSIEKNKDGDFTILDKSFVVKDCWIDGIPWIF